MKLATAITVAAAFCLWLAVLFSTATYYAAIVVVAVAGIAWGFHQLRKARLLEDVPRSTIRAAAQGYVDLHGVAALTPLKSPLSGTPCCWWSLAVWSRNLNNEWKLLPDRFDFSDELIRLVDDTGECLVNPADAEISGMQRVEKYGVEADPALAAQASHKSRYRFVEETLPAGAALTINGLLTCLPRDFPSAVAGAATDMLVKPPDGRRFLISAMAEDRAVAHYRGAAGLAFRHVFVLVVMGLLVEQTWQFLERQEPCPEASPVAAACVLGDLYREMSMRAPADAPPLTPSEQEAVDRALADSQPERAD